MAVIQTKTFTGTTGNNNWSWKIIVTEETGSVANKTSPVKVEAYLGRPNSASYFYGYATITYRAGSQTYTQNFNASSQISVPAGGWYKMGEYTFNVSNTGTSANPTVITLSANMSGASFSPNTANASGSITLAVLHEAPSIYTATMVETNQDMIDLNVPNTTIVPWLSQKTITLDAEGYDDATLEYRLRHAKSDYYLPSADTYQASNVFNADYRTNYVPVDNGKVNIVQIVHDSTGVTSSDMLYVDINGVADKPNGIPYEKPTLEKTSTTIKRKSGNGTNLTDNKANINVKGLIYKQNDVIGNNNSVQSVGYKIWERDATEPQNYTSLTPTTDSSGNVTVTDYEISNIDFTKAYKYKIIIIDDYGYSYEIEDTVPTGQPTWTEYKDRVDFMAITIGQNAIIESGDNSDGYYIKYYDGTMICYGIVSVSANSNSVTWDFPEEFVDANIFATGTAQYVGGQTTSADIVITIGAITKTDATFYNWVSGRTTPNYARNMRVFAIGKWK